jgi:hypothetical protein
MLLLKSFMNERSVDSAPPVTQRFLPQQLKAAFTFIAHQGLYTQILAYMLDSLVRVSRRVIENHFVKIANPPVLYPAQYPTSQAAELCSPNLMVEQGPVQAAYVRVTVYLFLKQSHGIDKPAISSAGIAARGHLPTDFSHMTT